MGVEEILVNEIREGGEHGAVVHVMPVQRAVSIGKARVVARIEKDGSGRRKPTGRSIECLVKILLVVVALNDRVVDLGPGDIDPCDDIGIDGAKAAPVDREIGKGEVLVLRNLCVAGQPIVGALLSPVLIDDSAKRRKRGDEHHNGRDEDDAPQTLLARRCGGCASGAAVRRAGIAHMLIG